MSILIDDLVKVCQPGNTSFRRVGTTRYIARPEDYIGIITLLKRVEDAWRILIGKSHAYHYWEDEN